MSTVASNAAPGIKFLSQAESQAIDDELMGPVIGFSVDQLMELAGQSVAVAITHVYPAESHPAVFIVCGPGNNGGDGLVAARHLFHFGYAPTVLYPKRTNKILYQNLVKQCEYLAIPVLDALPDSFQSRFQLIVDSIFGFGFSGPIRSPFDSIIKELAGSSLPIVSVDVPSGWDVSKGPFGDNALQPDMLVSLTAPKQCSVHFKGQHHYLGGRFVPPSLEHKYQLNLPKYPGTDVCLALHPRL